MLKQAWVDLDSNTYANILSGRSTATEVAIRNVETARFQQFANLYFDNPESSTEKNTAAAIGVGLAVTAVAALGCYAYKCYKKRKEQKKCERSPDFLSHLEIYFDQAHNGCLEMETVNSLLASIDEMNANHPEQYDVISPASLSSVVNFVNDYTQKVLFENTKRTTMELIVPNYEATFYNLKKCLQMQKQVLQQVA